MFRQVGPESPGRIGLDPAQLTGDPAQQAAWREDELVHDIVTLRAGEQAAEMARVYPARIGEAGCPVLVLVGSGDTADPGGRSLAGEGIEVREVEGRHDLLHDRDAAATLAAVRDWIAQRVSSP